MLFCIEGWYFRKAPTDLFLETAKSDHELRYVCLSAPLSARNNSSPTACIIMKIYIWGFFENMSRKSKFHKTPTAIAVLYTKPTLCTFVIISRSNVLTVRNVSAERFRETQNTHFMFNDLYRKSCRLWDNVEKYDKARQTTGDNQSGLSTLPAVQTHTQNT